MRIPYAALRVVLAVGAAFFLSVATPAVANAQQYTLNITWPLNTDTVVRGQGNTVTGTISVNPPNGTPPHQVQVRILDANGTPYATQGGVITERCRNSASFLPLPESAQAESELSDLRYFCNAQ